MSSKPLPEIRVLLVDGHRIVRHALRALIDSHDGYRVVGDAGTHAAAIASAQAEQPDVIVTELDLESDRTSEFLSDLVAAAAASRVLILTGETNVDAHKHAIRLGAHGIVMKHDGCETLLKAISKVHHGELWIDRTMTANLIVSFRASADGKARDPERARIDSVTKREREVIALIAQGLKNKEIAERLFISENTVRHHLTAIFSKLRVSDRLSLVVYAGRNGLHKSEK